MEIKILINITCFGLGCTSCAYIYIYSVQNITNIIIYIKKNVMLGEEQRIMHIHG